MKNENVVVKQNCHSRVFLSGIPTLDTQSGGDPRLQSSGMTLNWITARGFTLIELLVVVLIIGILVAVALPQYQKAVEKSRLTTLISWMKSVADAEEIYFMQNGIYTDNISALDISIDLFDDPQATDKTVINGQRIFRDNIVSGGLLYGSTERITITWVLNNSPYLKQKAPYINALYTKPGGVCRAANTDKIALSICKALGPQLGTSTCSFLSKKTGVNCTAYKKNRR